MKEKIQNLLGIATKARLIVCGEEQVIDSVRKNKVKIVFVASDCSDKTIDKFNKKCFFYNIELCLLLNSIELSDCIGKTRKIIGITDEGIYKSLKKYIGGRENEGERNS